MPRLILHLDMNSYFASVEQQANPLLRGKPVGVCAYKNENGCILASSREAKDVGVRTGMRVRAARQLCPNLIVVENEPAKYRSTTKRIFAILAQYTDRFEPYSIDEGFLDLTGLLPDTASAVALASNIRQRIKNEVGDYLACSIGISWTRWLAKFASDIATKDQTLLITPETLSGVLAGRPLIEAWGIGRALNNRLRELGIRTLDGLAAAPVGRLQQALGVTGFYMWAHVHGIELGGGAPQREHAAKSIGHSYCVPRHTTDRVYLRAVLAKLCEKVGRRLRAAHQTAGVLSAQTQYIQGGGQRVSQRLAEPIYTTEALFANADRFLFSTPPTDRVRFLSVTASRLAPVSTQESLFADQRRQTRLTLALDAINDKFGECTVVSGGMWQARTQAPDRIGFRTTVTPLSAPSATQYVFE